MSIVLKKDQKVSMVESVLKDSVTVSDPGTEESVINNIDVCIGWDISNVPKEAPKGFMGMLKGLADSIEYIDCDVSVFLTDDSNRLVADGLIYFGKLESRCGGITHSGDHRTGEEDGDNEVISVDFKKIPLSVHKLVFVISIFKSGEKNIYFENVKNSFVRIVDKNTEEVLLSYDLDEDYKGMRSVLAGELTRENSGWVFTALGQGSKAKNIKEIRKMFG